jgi:hypothetical protein
MTLEASFVQQTVSFSTTGTQVLPYGATNWSPNPSLNLSGTLSLASGSNGFSGAASTTGGGVGNAPMTGTANGVFYGPQANEVGGAFWVSGGGVTTYAGGFGGKRQ